MKNSMKEDTSIPISFLTFAALLKLTLYDPILYYTELTGSIKIRLLLSYQHSLPNRSLVLARSKNKIDYTNRIYILFNSKLIMNLLEKCGIAVNADSTNRLTGF